MKTPMHPVDKTLNGISLRCATIERLYYTLHVSNILKNELAVAEWLGVVLFTSIVSVHHIVGSNFFIAWFTPLLAWLFQQFYVNDF